EAAIFDLALADADLKGLLVRVAEVNVIDVFHQLVVASALRGAKDEGTGVERQAEPLDVVAEDHNGVDVLADAADLALQADANAVQRGNIDEATEMLDFLIERRAELRGRNAQGDDLGGLGQAADGGELFVMGLFLGRDLDVESDNVEPLG